MKILITRTAFAFLLCIISVLVFSINVLVFALMFFVVLPIFIVINLIFPVSFSFKMFMETFEEIARQIWDFGRDITTKILTEKDKNLFQ